jgi:protocatechuate 3,4-dioxygenase beta subunit
MGPGWEAATVRTVDTLPTDRVVELVDAVTTALRDVVERHQVTETEWYTTLRFLTEVGQADECILLSDVLGLSVLVDRLAHADGGDGVTASNVLGPFWRPAPDIGNGGSLVDPDEPGERLVVRGTIRSVSGDALGGARLDVWQSNADGIYDVQLPSGSGPRCRGCLAAAADGTYEFHTVVPPPYQVKKDGPVGALLAKLGRHHFRPAHLHYKVAAQGYQPLTTMLFFAGDPWLGNDVIGADKPSLTVKIDRSARPATATFDVVLRPQGP